jgi:hypothetical protein
MQQPKRPPKTKLVVHATTKKQIYNMENLNGLRLK